MSILNHSLCRRQVLINTTKLLAGLGAGSALSFSVLSNETGQLQIQNLDQHQLNTITLLSRYMFPHETLDTSYYQAVAQSIDQQINTNSDLAAMIENGVSTLDKSVKGSWLATDKKNKITAMRKIEKQPFFGLILNTSIDVLYRHPDVWKLVGYEGSSIEHGGYLYRGFDDIDWLTR